MRISKQIALLTAVVATLLLAISAAPALATTGHSFAGSFGGPGEENGQFQGGPFSVGVGLAGEVFVTDGGRLQGFDGSGAFQSSSAEESFLIVYPGIAVDSAPAGGVYVPGFPASTFVSSVQKYSAAGVFEFALDPGLSETSFGFSGSVVAVDPANGIVYTTATNNNTGATVIDSFGQSTGAFIASFNGETGSPDGGFVCPSGLAVDPTHHVYVLEPCKGIGRVDRYSATGTWEATIDDGSRGTPLAVATDPKTGEVYVADSGPSGLLITNLSAEGTSVLYTIPASNIGALSSLAVGPDGTVYAFDNATSVVDRFTAFVGPTVTTAPASEPPKTTSATFNGTIDPGGIASTYHYEYGLDTTYGSSTAPIDAGSGSGAIEAPGPVTGLTPNTTYHYRIVGTTSGPIVGEDQTLTTEAAPPAVDGSPSFVTSITPTGARVHGTVDPEHSLARFSVEYGTTTAYGFSTPEGGVEVGEQSVDTPVATTLSGLEPGTEYHYRLSAEDGVEGAQTGADATFITAPATPGGATELSTKRATLTGTIDPHGEATSYRFEYGPSTAYGAATEETSGGSGEGEQQVTEPITGLTPGTTYHVRVVATTNGVTRSGADGTFTTAPAPAAEATDPTAVSPSGATLQGTTNTFGQSGTYHFEVSSLDGTYSANTAEQALSAASGSRQVSFAEGSLPPAETFRVRLVVTSNEATTVSEPVEFSTPAIPPETFPPPPSPGSVYGCTAPRLNPVNGTVKPGAMIAVSGSDLGLEGSILLGEDALNATSWSASGFTIEVPTDAAGTLGLTVNCGVASNTVAVATSRLAVRVSTQPKAKPTRAQLLAKALKSCAKKKGTKKRMACKRQAEKTYGAKKAAAKKAER